MSQVCHAVDRIGDTRVLFKRATAVRLCAAARAVQVWRLGLLRHPEIPSQRARIVGWKKPRHLASAWLICMQSVHPFGSFLRLKFVTSKIPEMPPVVLRSELYSAMSIPCSCCLDKTADPG